MRDELALSAASRAPAPIPLRTALRVWMRIGWLSFGGPAGQIALMHRILVEELRWIGEARFLHALNYCMFLPGPEAQQLATYIGWLLNGTIGGLAAGILFVVPGALCVLVLSIVYASYGHVSWVDALFYGLKPAVIAVVAEALVRVGKRALKSPTQIALAALAFLALFVFGVPFPIVVVAAALIGWIGARSHPEQFPSVSRHAAKSASESTPLVDALFESGAMRHTRPTAARAVRVVATCGLLWIAPIALVAALFGKDSVFVDEGRFFSEAAVVTFGGAYAVLAYVAQAAVANFHWLAAPQMLDGLGLAETTPGPLILVTQFVGFLGAWNHPGALSPLAAGLLGAFLTTWVTFVPCFLWIFLGAPYVESLREHRSLGGALSAITAAVVGVIANLGVWFALHVVFREHEPVAIRGLALALPIWSSVDWLALALSLGSIVAMLRFRTEVLATLGVSALIGGVVHHLFLG